MSPDPERTLEFWFEFGSTYSYPAAMRIEALAAARGVVLRWCPFLLGPIFQEQGWNDSPFNLYPAKGEPARAGSEPGDGLGNEIGEA